MPCGVSDKYEKKEKLNGAAGGCGRASAPDQGQPWVMPRRPCTPSMIAQKPSPAPAPAPNPHLWIQELYYVQ